MEGEIITKLENAMVNEDVYDMDSYLSTAEQIANQKLAMYSELLSNIKAFKHKYHVTTTTAGPSLGFYNQ